MSAIRKLITAWLRTLACGCLFPLMSIAAVSGTMHDTPSAMAPATFTQQPTAVSRILSGETALQSMESAQEWSYLGLSHLLIAPRTADEFVDVYRVYGDDARAQGFSWTTTDPRSVRNFRDGAGLPSGGASGANNSADFLIQGRAKASDVIKFKSADPLDGNIGGLPELIINPNNVDIIDFQVIKP